MNPPLRVRRILMTTDCVGGVFTFSASLARGLAARGIQVDIVTLGPRPRPDQRALLDGCDRITVTETDLLLEWQDPEGLDDDRARAELAAIAAWLSPDLIHLNSFREARLAWPVPVVVVAHSCVNSWAEGCGRQHDFTAARWQSYSRALAEGLASADAWVAPTASFGAAIDRCYAPVRRAQIIHNGIAQDDIEQDDMDAATREPKQPFVLAAGRLWDRAKNLALLIEAAGGASWPIRIAGPDTLEYDTMPHMAAANVEMLGSLSNARLRALMRKAAIFASPARYEPFGLAVLEAAAAGCALILSDIDTLRELWDGAALFVPPQDAPAWRRAIERLSHDDGLRLALQVEARERAARFDLRRTVEAYIGLYERLARARSRGFSLGNGASRTATGTSMEAGA